MSCPHLHPDTMAECSRAAFDYNPACYCVFSWVYADPPPGRKYLGYPAKWLHVAAWRASGSETPDQYLIGVHADSGPELLRNLRGALAGLGPAAKVVQQNGQPQRPLRPESGNGWIPSAPQTTEALNVWPS